MGSGIGSSRVPRSPGGGRDERLAHCFEYVEHVEGAAAEQLRRQFDPELRRADGEACGQRGDARRVRRDLFENPLPRHLVFESRPRTRYRHGNGDAGEDVVAARLRARGAATTR